jgi:hypothetical protein
MNMSTLWNGGKVEQRTQMLTTIYGKTAPLYLASTGWEKLPYGVQERMNRCWEMFKRQQPNT